MSSALNGCLLTAVISVGVLILFWVLPVYDECMALESSVAEEKGRGRYETVGLGWSSLESSTWRCSM